MNSKLNIFDRIVEDLMNELPFSKFKFRKRDSSICDISKSRSLYVELRHWTDSYAGILYIDPIYCVRYNVLEKWYEPFSTKSIQDQRSNPSYFMYDKDLFHWPQAFKFQTNGDYYNSSFQTLYCDMISKVSFYFSQYDTLQGCFDMEILPVLMGKKELPENGSDWVFEDLALCKLVSPESYPRFKKIVMKHVDYLMSKVQYTMFPYSMDRINEILHYLETTDITSTESKKTNKSTMASLSAAEPPKTKRSAAEVKEYEKLQADVRRSVGRRYGFKQNSYINYKVENGYFFCIDFLAHASIYVKPMYVDDLWWDIFHASDNKNEPVSLRGTGAFSVDGQQLAKFDIPETTDRTELELQYEHLFKRVITIIRNFLAEHPNPDHFYPDKQMMTHNPYNLLNILALIHNNRNSEAARLASEALQNDKSCGMLSYKDNRNIDGFESVIEWCNRHIAKQQ